MKRMTQWMIFACLLLPTAAFAQSDGSAEGAASTTSTEAAPEADTTTADSKSEEPSVFHRPTTWARGGVDTDIYATVYGDWKLQRVTLGYRPADEANSEYREIEFERASTKEFVAVIPKEAMQPPGVDYYIASQSDDGRELHFASPESPQHVVVTDETELTREKRRLARHDGNRSEFELSGEFTDWGRSAAFVDGTQDTTDSGSDWMWKSTLQYRYRFLGNPYEIAFGLGVIRGNLATVSTEDGTVVASPIPGLPNDSSPGMNYGWGQLTWEFHRNFSVDARLLFGASATGFAAGVGGVARIGRIGGTRLEFGGEAFQDIGSLGFMAFHWDTLPRLPMGLAFEFSNRPNPNGAAGTRLMYDIGYEFTDAFALVGTVGVPIRNSAVASGWTGGLDVKYAF